MFSVIALVKTDAGVDFLFDWGSHIISTAKTASKKIAALIRSMKFLSPEVALYH